MINSLFRLTYNTYIKKIFKRHENAECHFLAPKGYTLDRLTDYRKDIGKYKVISDKITFIFWVDGICDTTVDEIVVRGYGKRYETFINHLSNNAAKRHIISCTDDIRVNLFILFLKYTFRLRILYYNLSLPTANKIMIRTDKRTIKYEISKYITYWMYRASSIITFTRIMGHEILYQTGEKNFKKFVSCDHTIRDGIADLINYRTAKHKEKTSPSHISLFTRFEKMKRSEDGIQAYLKSNAFGDGIELHVYGGGTEFADVKSRYQKIHQIKFHGQVKQSEVMEALLNSLFIIAPHSGGVSLEAAAAQRAVISYGCNAMPEYIVDNVTGVLIDLDDQFSFVEGINLLYLNQEYREAMGLRAYQILLERYSGENMQRSHSRLARKIEELL